MKFCIKFLLATIILMTGSFTQNNAHTLHELNKQLTPKITEESVSYSANEHFANFSLSSFPSEQKKRTPTKDVAEIEEIEEENETNSSKKYLEGIQHFSSFFYFQLLKQLFVCSNNLLSLVKLCSYISPEYHYLLFQVFRI